MSNKNNKQLHFKNELYLSDRVKLQNIQFSHSIHHNTFIYHINNLTYLLFKTIEQNIGLKVIIIYVVSLPFKFRTRTSTQHVPFCTPNMVILPIYGITSPRGGGGEGE